MKRAPDPSAGGEGGEMNKDRGTFAVVEIRLIVNSEHIATWLTEWESIADKLKELAGVEKATITLPDTTLVLP